MQAAPALKTTDRQIPEGSIVWEPLPGSQQVFLTCPIYEALYEGTRGPGKTECLLMDFAQHCGQGFGADWRGVLFRQTYKQLDDVITKSREIFYRAFPEISFNASSHEWRWTGGETLLLRYMDKPDDYWHYHGHEFSWIGWEELTNWPDLECYHRMKSCSRSSTKGVPRKYRATANPWGRGHNAVKRYFRIGDVPRGVPFEGEEGMKRVVIRGHWSENTPLLEATPDYPSTIASSATNPAQRQAWLEGSWDIQAGGMFDDLWDSEIHVIEPFSIPRNWRIDRSFDWGSASPYSVGWWAESNGEEVELANGDTRAFPAGTLFRVMELYGHRGSLGANEGTLESPREIAQKINQTEEDMFAGHSVQPGPADNQVMQTQATGETIADQMRRAGVTWTRSDKSRGSRVTGWALIRQRLKASLESPMEEPGLFVFAGRCPAFVELVPSLPRSDKDPEDIPKTGQEDHIADETRYRVMTRRHEVSYGRLPWA